MKPALSVDAKPSELSPRPFMCECGAIRDERPADDVDGSGALCAGGADVEAAAEVEAFIVVNVEQGTCTLMMMYLSQFRQFDCRFVGNIFLFPSSLILVALFLSQARQR
jgi:hypothetical protein